MLQRSFLLRSSIRTVPTTSTASGLRRSYLKTFSAMSTSNLLSKLSASLQEFVRTAARDNAAFGNADQESAELSEWLSKVSSLKISNPADLKHLDDTLSSKTYLVGTSPTVADIALYGTLHASVVRSYSLAVLRYDSILLLVG